MTKWHGSCSIGINYLQVLKISRLRLWNLDFRYGDELKFMLMYALRLRKKSVVISLMEAGCFRYGAVAETRSAEVIPVRFGNKFPRSG